MLTRSSQVGEFYVMSPPQIPPKGDGLHTCDLLVYDEESDRHVRITWEDALEATLINDAEGFYTAAADTTMADGNQNTTTLGSWADAARKWSTYNKGDGDYKAAAADGGIDVRIIIARPFIEHLMHNVVMTVCGPRHRRDPLRPGGHAAFAPTRRSRRSRATTPATSRPWSPSRRTSWS